MLHELVHSAGYPGPDNHNDVGGPKTDEIYKCSQWCTGRSLRSRDAAGDLVYDPMAELDLDDCVYCSGTKAARDECCNDKHACSDGCCPVACAADGSRPERDPCDPRTNDLDFWKCAFDGATERFGNCATAVTWVYDHFSGSRVFLVPVMGNSDCSTGLDNPDCAVAPLDHDIAAGDGQLVLDYAGSEPRYSGYGHTDWTLTVECPGFGPQTVAFVSGWFAQEQPTAFQGGRTISGHAVVEGAELTWAFSYRR